MMEPVTDNDGVVTPPPLGVVDAEDDEDEEEEDEEESDGDSGRGGCPPTVDETSPLRDHLVRRLHRAPLFLSCRQISRLRVTDFTEDDGATYAAELVVNDRRIGLDDDFITDLDRYLFRHGRCGVPFLEWRPDIPPYVFQSTRRFSEDQSMSRSAIGNIITGTRRKSPLSTQTAQQG